jgi:hypothetical protein
MKQGKKRLFEMMEMLNPNSTKNLKEEQEGKYYKPKLQNIIQNSQEILNNLDDNAELDAWIQDKITIAEHNMSAILEYMKSSKDSNES